MKNRLSIEKALDELEEISSKMESEEITLSKSLEMCEKAKELIKFCEDEISKAKQKITELEMDN